MRFARGSTVLAWLSISLCLVLSFSGSAQTPIEPAVPSVETNGNAIVLHPYRVDGDATKVPSGRRSSSAVALYFDRQLGISFAELARRTLSGNGELTAARLEVERARARLRQAGARPNPTLDFEQTTGRLTGSSGESETSIGLTVPIELGQRGRRIDLAEIELRATEAEIADRERRVMLELRTAYAEALTGLRELEITETLGELDLQLVRFVQARVNEGETAPIELNLLRVDNDRLRSRRALIEGRLRVALLQLKILAGIPESESLRLSEPLHAARGARPPGSVEAAMEIALRTRPDLRFARLTEEAAAAGLNSVRAQARPSVTAFGRFNYIRSVTELTPIGRFPDGDKTITFGASVGLPVFNRNQGAKAEAALVIAQARTRREFLENVVRSEVQRAFVRYEAAQVALTAFETGVIERSNENIRTIRAAYELGQFSITELLAEQRRMVDAQREFTEALAERYRALAELQAVMGAAVSPQD
jgi:cobalt-zinc-cadmium efflux system outer membrane protein